MQDIFKRAHYQNFEYLKVVELAKRHFTGKSVLDVGCGQGKYLKIFDKYSGRVTGIDLNPMQVSQLREEGYRVYLPDDIPVNETFDVVFISHVIEHLSPSELIDFLEKYIGMLKNTGVLIIISPVLGERFFYDFSHIRPYYPQSIWMLFGDLICSASYKSASRIELDDIYFFYDSFRLRGNRYYYPCVAQHEPRLKFFIFSNIVRFINVIFALLHVLSKGRFGRKASWMGIYKKLKS